MGAKQAKVEGIYLPETPTALKQFKYTSETPKPLTVSTDLCITGQMLDPRSPNGNRTPILVISTAFSNLYRNNVILQQPFVPEPLVTKTKQTVPSMLRKRFLKSFHYNLNDPRSPSSQLTRTPLVFEDATERTFSLDDTFADLLVESRAPPPAAETTTQTTAPQPEEISEPNTSVSFVSVESAELTVEQHTPVACLLQQPLDPRSPTVGLERTPLIFCDTEEDEKLEDEMLENVLAKLSLDLSSAAEHSLVSLGSLSQTDSSAEILPPAQAPTNKHLERVRLNVPCKPKRLRRLVPTTTSPLTPQIYEDCENMTPKSALKSTSEDCTAFVKRTPLSCLGNKSLRQLDRVKEHARQRLAIESMEDSIEA